MTTIQITTHDQHGREALHRAIQAVIPFASKDGTREHLHAIHFDPLDGNSDPVTWTTRIVATDGHTLITVDVPGVSVEVTKDYSIQRRPGTMTIPSAKLLASAAKAALPIPEVPSNGLTFPPYRKVIPAQIEAGEREPVGIDARYLMRAGQAAERVIKALGNGRSNGRSALCQLDVSGPMDPIVVRVDTRATIVVMPCRL